MSLAEIEAYEKLFPTGTIIDGVVDGEQYFKSSPKIAWFLKEAYTDEEEGWHIKKYYGQEDAYWEFFRTAATPTWHPIIYASYGILNGFLTWEEMPYIRNKPEMCDVINKVALINANKFPSLTGTRTIWKNLAQGYQSCKDIILQQIATLQPDIHIFCGTFLLYRERFGIGNEHAVERKKGFENCGAWIKDGKLFMDVYHPAQTKQTREVYVDQIVNAVAYWKLITANNN
ncbi:hypothetical protein [Rufibacter quisquiliarum]|uniref:Uracil DNA glycosylase superfamily protein n=1 Tax=Rufibacter quisquiliarum TaxID=1549639 RepID=A0A839GHW0_9BACT|nr:hypothetical protein [Rufibacter quisquiliarum]MBA9078200.1 hypothetical protein [Rufibacter quisquiliarum]